MGGFLKQSGHQHWSVTHRTFPIKAFYLFTLLPLILATAHSSVPTRSKDCLAQAGSFFPIQQADFQKKIKNISGSHQKKFFNKKYFAAPSIDLISKTAKHALRLGQLINDNLPIISHQLIIDEDKSIAMAVNFPKAFLRQGVPENPLSAEELHVLKEVPILINSYSLYPEAIENGLNMRASWQYTLQRLEAIKKDAHKYFGPDGGPLHRGGIIVAHREMKFRDGRFLWNAQENIDRQIPIRSMTELNTAIGAYRGKIRTFDGKKEKSAQINAEHSNSLMDSEKWALATLNAPASFLRQLTMSQAYYQQQLMLIFHEIDYVVANYQSISYFRSIDQKKNIGALTALRDQLYQLLFGHQKHKYTAPPYAQKLTLIKFALTEWKKVGKPTVVDLLERKFEKGHASLIASLLHPKDLDRLRIFSKGPRLFFQMVTMGGGITGGTFYFYQDISSTLNDLLDGSLEQKYSCFREHRNAETTDEMAECLLEIYRTQFVEVAELLRAHDGINFLNFNEIEKSNLPRSIKRSIRRDQIKFTNMWILYKENQENDYKNNSEFKKIIAEKVKIGQQNFSDFHPCATGREKEFEPCLKRALFDLYQDKILDLSVQKISLSNLQWAPLNLQEEINKFVANAKIQHLLFWDRKNNFSRYQEIIEY